MTKIKVILLVSIFITSNSFACEDFKDCMETYTWEKLPTYSLEGKSTDGHDYKYVKTPSQVCLLKAIAYKLDEISKTNEAMGKTIENISEILERFDRYRK